VALLSGVIITATTLNQPTQWAMKYLSVENSMGRVTYIEHDGKTHVVELSDGTSLMEGAVANGVRGIDGDCGGCCSCATCHVHVDPAWTTRAGPPASEPEAEMLQLAPEFRPDSRLSCQIKMHAELDGIIVHLPESQH
jgi:ferredoxin, 2Fe-2S